MTHFHLGVPCSIEHRPVMTDAQHLAIWCDAISSIEGMDNPTIARIRRLIAENDELRQKTQGDN